MIRLKECYYQQFYNSPKINLHPNIGFSDVEILDEELDYGSMILIDNRKDRYPIMSYLTYTFKDDENYEFTRKFLIGEDIVNPIERLNTTHYEHSLSLVEITKKFERKLGSVTCFTQPTEANSVRYTIFDCIIRLLEICPLHTTSQVGYLTNNTANEEWSILIDNIVYKFPYSLHSSNFNVNDRNTWTGALDIVAPQMILSEGTLKDKINAVLQYVNGILRLEDYNKIAVTFFNAISSTIVNKKPVSHTISQNIEEYANSLTTFAQNTIMESNPDESSIYEPSINTYKSVNSDEYVINDSNQKILTNYPIYSMQEVDVVEYAENKKMKYRISLSSYDNTLQDYKAVDSFEIDYIPITTRIIEKEQYDALDNKLLSPAGGFSEYPANEEELKYYIYDYLVNSNTIYYKYKNNYISLNETTKKLLLNYSIFDATKNWSLLPIMYEKYIKTAYPNFDYTTQYRIMATSYYEDDYTTHVFDLCTIYHKSSGSFELNVSVSTSYVNYNQFYRIKYVPLIDTSISKAVKEKVENGDINSEIIQNQGTKMVSLDYYLNSLYGKVQRLSNKRLQLNIVVKSIKDLPTIGNNIVDQLDNNNEYKITQMERIYFPTHIIVKLQLDKNYNRLNEYIGIDAEWRGWESPSGDSTYTRDLEYSQYCIFSDNVEDITDTIDTSWINSYQKFHQIQFYANDNTREKMSIKNVVIFPTNTILINYLKGLGYGTLVNKLKDIELPITSYGGGKTLTFNLRFLDNMTCGQIITEKDGFGKILTQKIPYCVPTGTDVGTLYTMSMKFVPKSFATTPDAMKSLPLIIKGSNTYTGVEIPQLLIYKDSSEILSFTYMVHLISNSDKIIIGKQTSIDNPMIVDKDITLYFKPSRELYKHNEYKAHSDISTKYILPTATFENLSDIGAYHISYTFPTGFEDDGTYKSWCICDENENVYFAINDINMKDIYIRFRDKRPDIRYDF